MKAYEYNRIKYLTFDLINVYHSVNDKATVEAVYAQTARERPILDVWVRYFFIDILLNFPLDIINCFHTERKNK